MWGIMGTTSRSHNSRRFADVLVVDDTYADRTLIREALLGSSWVRAVHLCETPEQALRALAGADGHEPLRPHLILCDLHMPGGGGRRLVEAVKADRKLRQVPIAMLSSSGATRDVADCYALGAEIYLRKPDDLDQLCSMMEELGNLRHLAPARERRARPGFLEWIASLWRGVSPEAPTVAS